MRPRILMVIDSEDYFSFDAHGYGTDAFTLVEYGGRLTQDDVEKFLREHTSEFDAVAVFSIYDNARQAIEQFIGPKILFKSGIHAYGYGPPSGLYTLQVKIPILPSEFETRVQEAFANL